MEKRNTTLIVLAMIFISSCNFSYSSSAKMHTKSKSIGGESFIFSNYVEYKNYQFFHTEDLQLTGFIIFRGMGEDIGKEIKKSDFEKKIDLKNIEAFSIDSISFSMNKKEDKIDLMYYFDLNDHKETVILELEKENETWNLN